MKTKTNKIPLFIGIAIIVLSEIAIFFLSRIDMTNASLLEQYDHATAGMFWNGLALLGWSICIIWGLVFLFRKKWQKSACKTCGAKIINSEDIFCRACGAKLSEEYSIEKNIPSSRRML